MKMNSDDKFNVVITQAAPDLILNSNYQILFFECDYRGVRYG